MNDTQNEQVPEESSMREALEAAYDASEEPRQEEPAQSTEPVGDAAPAPEGRARDERGRFAARAPEAEAQAQPEAEPAVPVAPVGGQPDQLPAAEPEPAPHEQELRAPQSWKPQAREAWNELPASVRDEVVRREREISTKLNETAEIRRVGESLLQAAAPYEQFMAMSGADPVSAAAHLYQTAAVLQHGNPAQKAQAVAQIVNECAVDVNMLDQILAGQMPAQQRQAPQAQGLTPEQVRQMVHEENQRTAQQRTSQQAQAEVRQFAETHEFYNDLRETMADLIGHAARNGHDMDLETAYNRACQLDEGISQILAQRAGAARAHDPAKAKLAASSVRGNPAGAPPRSDSPKSVREAILAAMDATEG